MSKPLRAESEGVMADLSAANNLRPTHYCRLCGAYWLKRSDSWSLTSKEAGKCCDNAPMDWRISPLVEAASAPEAAPQYRELLKEALPYVWIVRADPEAGKAAEAFAVKVMSALGIKEGETE
jgi:hypothetical protein